MDVTLEVIVSRSARDISRLIPENGRPQVVLQRGEAVISDAAPPEDPACPADLGGSAAFVELSARGQRAR